METVIASNNVRATNPGPATVTNMSVFVKALSLSPPIDITGTIRMSFFLSEYCPYVGSSCNDVSVRKNGATLFNIFQCSPGTTTRDISAITLLTTDTLELWLLHGDYLGSGTVSNFKLMYDIALPSATICMIID